MYIRTARPTRRGRGVVVGLIAGAIALAPAFGMGMASAAPTDSPPPPPVTTVAPAPEAPAQSTQTASQPAPVKEAPAPQAPPPAPAPSVDPPAPPKAPAPAPPVQETAAPAPAPVTATIKEAPAPVSPSASAPAATSTVQLAPETKAPGTSASQPPSSTPAPTSAAPTSTVTSVPGTTQDKPKVTETSSPEATATSAERPSPHGPEGVPSTSASDAPPVVAPGTSSEAPVTTNPVTSAPSTSAIPAVDKSMVARTPDPLPEKVSDDAIKKARDATPVDVAPPVASKDQMDTLLNAVRKSRDNDHTTATPSSSTSATSTTATSGRNHDDDDHWDGKVHPWQWVRYDDRHRPVIYNPYNNPYDFVYYDGPDRHVVRVNPGVSVSVTVINNGVFSFTAVRVNAFGVAVNVAVGNWYVPPPDVPYAPPPVYQNVNVYYTQVNVTVNQYRYVPVHSITDCGPDYGHRRDSYGNPMSRVLYNGTSVGWGTWGTDDRGNRIFNAADFESVPGITDPGQGVPDWLLASNETSTNPGQSSGYSPGVVLSLVVCAVIFTAAAATIIGVVRRRKGAH